MKRTEAAGKLWMRRAFDFKSRNSAPPSGPPGWRAYVVGDVHGRLDLLKDLLSRVEQDMDGRPRRKTLLTFVGDLIDRGPNSAQVIEHLRTYAHAGVRKAFLLGNHEEALLRSLKGDTSVLANWLQFGGVQCMQSYGLDAAEIRELPADRLLQKIQRAIPDDHVEFLATFADSYRFGDFLFVHAGIRPGIEVEAQNQVDLRWIREPFLSDDTDHGFVVVHGHTITKKVEVRRNRIGIDTGAYRTGVLTALAIEGSQTWLIDTRQAANQRLDGA